MSRTVRRKNEPMPRWMNQPWTRVEFEDGTWAYHRLRIDYESDSYKRNKIDWHQDKRRGRYNPPAWWNNLYQKEYRTKVRSELARWFKDSEYEVIIEDKPSRGYWW